MNVTRVRPLQRTEWPQGTKAYGTQVETWPAVYARHQPRGGKKDQPVAAGFVASVSHDARRFFPSMDGRACAPHPFAPTNQGDAQLTRRGYHYGKQDARRILFPSKRHRLCAGCSRQLLASPVSSSTFSALISSMFTKAWEKQVLSARGFKRVGKHSEYAT